MSSIPHSQATSIVHRHVTERFARAPRASRLKRCCRQALVDVSTLHSDHLIVGFDKHCRSQRNQLESPFLRLPTELRNTIYDHVSRASTLDVSISHRGFGRAARSDDVHAIYNIPLRLTCRQIKVETADLIYEAINFGCYMNVSIIESYLSQRTALQLESIKTIRISRDKYFNPSDWDSAHYRDFKFLGRLPNVEKITIVLKLYDNLSFLSEGTMHYVAQQPRRVIVLLLYEQKTRARLELEVINQDSVVVIDGRTNKRISR